MKAVKLVTKDWKTRVGYWNETQWKPGVTVTATGTGGLCTDGVVHSYRDEYVAAYMNPAHANIQDPVCIRLKTPELLDDDGTKLGTRSATPTGEVVKLPIITTDQRVEIAIRCALEVYSEPNFVAWALHWVDGSDRTAAAADAARAAASAATYAAASAATYAASAATYAAASAATYATNAATYAAASAVATEAACTATEAACTAEAAAKGKSFNLAAIIQEVLKK